MPFSTPYSPFESTAIDVHVLPVAAVPRAQSRTCSRAAFAADAAEDAPLASMMAAPRFWTVGVKTVSTQLLSLMAPGAAASTR